MFVFNVYIVCTRLYLCTKLDCWVAQAVEASLFLSEVVFLAKL